MLQLELAERLGVEVEIFDIIYKLGEWLETALIARTPQKEEERVTGKVKVLKHFSTQKNLHVLGGRLEEGDISARTSMFVFSVAILNLDAV